MQNKDHCYIVTACNNNSMESLVFSNMSLDSALRVYKQLEAEGDFSLITLSKELEVKKTIEVTYSLA